MKTIVLLPTYNERENIKKTIELIFEVSPEVHVLVIDDSSPDGTADVVRDLTREHLSLELLIRDKKTGLGDAYKAGYAHVLQQGYSYIITMDADGSHNPAYIPTMLEKMNRHDLVVGSRYIKQGKVVDWELWRRLLSAAGNIYTRILTGMPMRDATSGFVCVRSDLVRKIDLPTIRASGYAYQVAFKWYCWRAGAKILEIPITFLPRREGESKLTQGTVYEGILTPIRLFFQRLNI